MSHFSAIGFSVDSEEAFGELLEQAWHQGEPTTGANGTYVAWSPGAGCELWAQFTGDDCIGGNPHFRGESRVTLVVEQWLSRPEGPLDGALYAWNRTEAGYPLVVDLPNSDSVAPLLTKGRTVTVQLAAFAHELEYWSSEADYESAPSDEPKLAVESFIPAGLFDDAENPPAYAVFTGRILKSERRTNPQSGLAFYWLLTQTLGACLDVVVDPLLFGSEIPAVGGVIQGHFWLSGLVIPEADEAR